MEFRKSDLKDGDIVTYRNGDKRIIAGKKLINSKGVVMHKLNYFTENLKNSEGTIELDIVKVERATSYKTVFERKEILDETEKRYLRDVIGPFRNKVKCIYKFCDSKCGEYITIELKTEADMLFPYFEKGTMYKNMEVAKEYTLKELGL